MPPDQRCPGNGQQAGTEAGDGGIDAHGLGGGGEEGTLSNDAAGGPKGEGRQDEAIPGEEKGGDTDAVGGRIGDFDGGMLVSLDLEEVGAAGLGGLIAMGQVEVAGLMLANAGDGQVPSIELFGQMDVVIAEHDPQGAMRGQGGQDGLDLLTDPFQWCGAVDEVAEHNQFGRIPIPTQVGDPAGEIVRGIEGEELPASTLGPGEADVEVRNQEESMFREKDGATGVQDDTGPGAPATWDGRHRWILPGSPGRGNAWFVPGTTGCAHSTTGRASR